MARKKGSKNKTKTKLPDSGVYKVTLKLLGRIYEAEGHTVDEALDKLCPGGWANGAGVIIIEKDGVKKEKIIAGNHIRSIFGMTSGTLRAVSLKWVRGLFT